MSEDIAFTDEEIGELIEFLRKEGLDPCDDAADLIESQAAELSALREGAKELRSAVKPVIEPLNNSWFMNSEQDRALQKLKALLSTRREEG